VSDPILAAVTTWARSLYDETRIAVNVQREDLSAMGAGPWVGIDVPEADFELRRFEGGGRPWDSAWSLDVMFGSGAQMPSGEAAYAACWELGGAMLAAIKGGRLPEIDNLVGVFPLSWSPETRWRESGEDRGQTVMTLSLEISLTSLGI